MAKEKNPDHAWLEPYEILHPKKRAFLLAYAQVGTVTHAAKIAGIARRTHYNWMEEGGPETELYKKALQDAHEQGVESLEREAYRRAVDGVDEPIVSKGEIIGTMKKYSDVLLIFMLKGAKPNKYRERFDVNTSNLTNEELDAKIAEYIRRVGIAAFTKQIQNPPGEKTGS